MAPATLGYVTYCRCTYGHEPMMDCTDKA